MVGRGKSKQAQLNELSRRLKEDRISQLPDHLICHILSPLPIEDTIKTSLLSTRWRNLWLSVPCLDLNSRKFPEFSSFLSFGDMFSSSGRISKVRNMFINPVTFKVIHHYSKVEPLPQFEYMSHLEVFLCVSDSNWLATFLEHFPNLKSFVLVVDNYFKKTRLKDMNKISFSPAVPQCFLPSLEFVDIENNISKEYASDFSRLLELVSYFMENSAILKKLTLRLHSKEDAYKYAIYTTLLNIQRPVNSKVLLEFDS